jgi:hypothetical protein
LPLILSIISRSMWPMRSPFGRRTAVPSTRSLAINWCGLAKTSVIFIIPCGLMKRDNAQVPLWFHNRGIQQRTQKPVTSIPPFWEE